MLIPIGKYFHSPKIIHQTYLPLNQITAIIIAIFFIHLRAARVCVCVCVARVASDPVNLTWSLFKWRPKHWSWAIPLFFAFMKRFLIVHQWMVHRSSKFREAGTAFLAAANSGNRNHFLQGTANHWRYQSPSRTSPAICKTMNYWFYNRF